MQLPFHLITQSGVTAAIGIALAAPTVSSIASAPAYPRLKARWSFLTITALIFLALVISRLVTAATSDYLVILLGPSSAVCVSASCRRT